MRQRRLPLQSAQQRAHLLCATQVLAIAFMASALALTHVQLPMRSYGVGPLSDITASGAVSFSVLHAYLIRGSTAALRWSLLAALCLAAAPIMGTIASQHTAWTPLTVVALASMAAAIQASHPGLRAGILDAIGRDIEARMARQRALSYPHIDR